MKSICILLQNDYAADPRVRRKAEALVAAGYSVDVLALPSTRARGAYTLNGVNVDTVSLGRKRGSLARYLFEYAAFFVWAGVKLARRMRARRYAVVDVNTLPDFLIFAALPARWRGAKLLLDMHEITPEFYRSKYGMRDDARVIRLLKRVEKASFDVADHVVTVNEPIRDLLVQRGLPRAKSTVVMNAVDESRFGSSAEPVPAEPARLGPGRFVMMYHGTLTEIYGLDLAIEAFAIVHDAMPGAELWILGDGPARRALQTMARRSAVAEKVKFFGAVPAADIPGWLRRCDVGVLPMRGDVFLNLALPNKLSEYIVMRKPVLISRLNAIRHYFTDQALEYAAPNDPRDLGRHMVRLYGDPDLRTRLAATAWDEYAPIRWRVMKQRYLAVVAHLVGSGRGARPAASEVAAVAS